MPYLLRDKARAFFYLRLYQVRVVRGILVGIGYFRNWLFKFRLRLIQSFATRDLTLVSTSDSRLKRVRRIHFAPASHLQVRGPRFIGDYDFSPIAEPSVQLFSPPLEVIFYEGVEVIGGTNFIMIGHLAVHPDLFDPHRDVCPAEKEGIATVRPHSNAMSIVLGKPSYVPRAISLLGSCTGNYAHWLTETLPKLLVAKQSGVSDEYPVLVDAWAHPNFIKSIRLIDGIDREVIKVPRWGTVKVDQLVDVTPPAYVPPEYRAYFESGLNEPPRASDFPFSHEALSSLRSAATGAVGIPVAAKPSRKLYLYRARESCGNTRQVANIYEVERLIASFGYEMLDPAKLPFEDQVKTFANAATIISPVGAALANAIFSPPGCRVLGLSPYYENANYYYFSNFMGALGHELQYVLGRQSEVKGDLVHRNYEVDMAALEAALIFLETTTTWS